MLNAGDIVDRYVVEGEIASGGMAEVYKVRHKQLGSVHAMKVLVLRTKDIRRRLLQEGRVQAALNHPNAIMVTDVVEVEGNPGLVMEYVDGPTLGDWVHMENPSFAEIEKVFRAVVSAIAEAHRVGLIHRDLKPSNVLLARSGGQLIPKVIDFGLAKVVEDARDEGKEDHTRTGVPMGTPSYMAPEQIADAKNVDARADLFSLGVVLYYICTKRKAFSGSNAVETYNAVLAGDFVPPEEVRPDIPENLRRAIRACMQINRNERVESAQALIEILDGEPAPVEATAPGASWGLPAVVGVLGVAVLIGGMVFASLDGPPPVAVDPPLPAVDVTTHEPPIETVGEDGPTEEVHRIIVKNGSGTRAQATPTELGTDGKPFCGARAGQVLGFVRVPGKAKRSDQWTMESPTPVARRADGPSAGCILPKGTTIRVVDKPVKVSGDLWLAVYGDAFSLP